MIKTERKSDPDLLKIALFSLILVWVSAQLGLLG